MTTTNEPPSSVVTPLNKNELTQTLLQWMKTQSTKYPCQHWLDTWERIGVDDSDYADLPRPEGMPPGMIDILPQKPGHLSDKEFQMRLCHMPGYRVASGIMDAEKLLNKPINDSHWILVHLAYDFAYKFQKLGLAEAHRLTMMRNTVDCSVHNGDKNIVARFHLELLQYPLDDHHPNLYMRFIRKIDIKNEITFPLTFTIENINTWEDNTDVVHQYIKYADSQIRNTHFECRIGNRVINLELLRKNGESLTPTELEDMKQILRNNGIDFTTQKIDLNAYVSPVAKQERTS